LHGSFLQIATYLVCNVTVKDCRNQVFCAVLQAWYGFSQTGYVMAIPREVEATISAAKLGRGRSRQDG